MARQLGHDGVTAEAPLLRLFLLFLFYISHSLSFLRGAFLKPCARARILLKGAGLNGKGSGEARGFPTPLVSALEN
jgi:hypothetical protein